MSEKINWRILLKKVTEKDIDDLRKIGNRYGFKIGKIVDEIGGMKGPFIEYSNPKRKLKGYATPESFRKILLKIKAEKAYKYWMNEMWVYLENEELADKEDFERVRANYLKAKAFYEKILGKKIKAKIDHFI